MLLLSAFAALAALHPASGRLLIRNGLVVDGTGGKPKIEDVRILGDKIQEIGKLVPAMDERVIDAEGLIVCPGFIDAHSRVEDEILSLPNPINPVRQGITTVVIGQDGLSPYPLSDFEAQLKLRGIPMNLCSFVGQTTLRSHAPGSGSAQTEKLADLLSKELKFGALGLSSGPYAVGAGESSELSSLAKVVAQQQALLICTMPRTVGQPEQMLGDLLQTARQAGASLQISTIKLDTQPVWNKAPDLLELFKTARKNGQDITEDVYPYLQWQAPVSVLVPSRKWSDRESVEKGMEIVGGPSRLLLTRFSPDKTWEGKTIEELAASTGKEPYAVVQDIVARTEGAKGFGSELVTVTCMNQSDVDAFVDDPFVMFCTDSSLIPSHPRGSGAFPKVLAYYVRQKKQMPLEEAIRKMTSLPAKTFRLKRRGEIAEGNYADLVLFDPNTIDDAATIQNPGSPAIGIRYVFINGTEVLTPAGPTKNKPGRFLKRGQ